MKIKTSELTGIALDWAVEKSIYPYAHECCLDKVPYSTDWAQGGPIIERERISIKPFFDGAEWLAKRGEFQCDGPTPLIAAMRCYCYAELGDAVEIPNDLCDQINVTNRGE